MTDRGVTLLPYLRQISGPMEERVPAANGNGSERRLIGVFGDSLAAKSMRPEIAMRLERFYSI